MYFTLGLQATEAYYDHIMKSLDDLSNMADRTDKLSDNLP